VKSGVSSEKRASLPPPPELGRVITVFCIPRIIRNRETLPVKLLEDAFLLIPFNSLPNLTN
jgi:hypothetical protein